LQILATVVMLRFISRAIAGSEWPAALSSFTFPRSVIAFGRPSAEPLLRARSKRAWVRSDKRTHG
jgi:hypothetical protein